jgi:hypothetical protein
VISSCDQEFWDWAERDLAGPIMVPHSARLWNCLLGGKDNISQEVRADFRDRA